jgi:hypothetical protein
MLFGLTCGRILKELPDLMVGEPSGNSSRYVDSWLDMG